MDPEDREIIFMEHLDCDDQQDWFFSDDTRCRKFFTALAGMNSIQPDTQYAPCLSLYDMDKKLQTGLHAVESAWDASADGTLSPELKELTDRFPSGCEEISREFRELVKAVSSMETGLMGVGLQMHSGWRRSTGELLMVDLEPNIGPRFYDFARQTVGCDGPPENENGFALSLEELSEHYLSECVRFGGPAVRLAQFEREIRALGLFTWIAEEISYELWGPGSPYPDAVYEILSMLAGAFGISPR